MRPETESVVHQLSSGFGTLAIAFVVLAVIAVLFARGFGGKNRQQRKATANLIWAAGLILIGFLVIPKLFGIKSSNEQTISTQNKARNVSPVETAGHMIAAQASAITGDQDATRAQLEAVHQDVMQSMRIADTNRRIDPERARAVALKIPGVRGAGWVDRQNLLVRVNGPSYRSYSTIDTLCQQLEPLGDTLWVTVNLQDATAGSGSASDTLRRNCQLPAGEHAFHEQQRSMDVIDPAVRAQHQASQQTMNANASNGKQKSTKGDEAALNAIPEI